jgi:hypothetical protein
MLTFHTSGVGRPLDVPLVPFYSLFDRRYAIYWDLYDTNEWAALKMASEKLPEGTVDSVSFGDPVLEANHEFQGFGLKRGEMDGKQWISSSDWFKVDLAVPFSHQAHLRCALASRDTGKAFEVSVDGRRILPMQSGTKDRDTTTIMEYVIPKEVSYGKKKVGVIFRVTRGEPSCKIFSCALAKRGE